MKVAPKGQSVSKAIPKSTKAAEVIKTELTKIVLESEKTQVKPKISEREIIADKAVVKKETIVEAPAVMVTSARYSDNELQEFTGVIQHEKVSALEELRMLKERLDDLTSFDIAEESMIYSMHMGEQGSEAQEKEKTYAQIQRIHEYIKKLEDALERIKNKTYGICRVCGCLIARERLMAVPITTLSASYKIHQKCPEDGIDKIEALKK